MTSQTTAIILQGGGALGAYQAGVYEELAAHDIAPDWIIGTSIGAINGAIIAGNKPEDRLALLKSFWQSLAPASSWLDAWSPASWLSMATPFAPYLAAAAKEGAVFGTIAQGVPGFLDRWRLKRLAFTIPRRCGKH
jgi:NTE family protein